MKRLLIWVALAILASVMLIVFISWTNSRTDSAELYYLITPVDSISRDNLKDAQLTVFEKGDTSNAVCKGEFAIRNENTPQELHRVTFTLPCASKDYTVCISVEDYLPLCFPLSTTDADGGNYFIDLGTVGLLHKNLSLIAETGLTDADAVVILNGDHIPVSTMKAVEISKIASMSVKRGDEAKEYLTAEELAAGKTSVIFVTLFD